MNGEATRLWALAVDTIRPQPAAFMCGMAARMAWKAEDRLIAMTLSHCSGGKSSTGETNCTPALLTSTSTPPSSRAACATMPAISAGRVMSAGECKARTP